MSRKVNRRPRGKNDLTGNKKMYAVSYIMLLPWLLIFILFTLIPIISAVVLSFSSYDMINAPKFSGMENYIRMLFGDDVFITALKNTILFALITGPLGYLLSFVFAWFISDLNDYARTFFTLLFYIPSLAGNVYMIWNYLFNGDAYGIINSKLIQLGLIQEPVQWLTDPKYNFWVVVIVVLWMSMGAGFLSFVAGFKQLNPELAEAGSIDGITNRWQELYYVTLPQMVPQLMIGAVLSISGSLAIGVQSSTLTGLPSTDYSTHTLLLHIQDMGYGRYEMGYACAIAVVLFLLMLISWTVISHAISRFSSD